MKRALNFLLLILLGLISFLNVEAELENKDQELELLQAVEQHPDSLEKRRQLAEYYYQTYRVSRAIEEWERILKIAPDDNYAKTALESIQESQEHITEFLDLVEKLLEKGSLKDLNRELESLDRKVVLDGHKARLLFLSGLLRKRARQLPEALLQFQKVIEFYSHTECYPRALWESALLRKEQKDYQRAVQLLEEIIRKFPQANLATAAEAEKVFIETREQSPTSAWNKMREMLDRGKKHPLLLLYAAEKAMEEKSVLYVEGIKLLGEVISEFPNSVYAERALAHLEKLLDSAQDPRILKIAVRSLRVGENMTNALRERVFFLRVNLLLHTAILSEEWEEIRSSVRETRDLLEGGLGQEGWNQEKMVLLKAKSFLIQGQKAAILERSQDALEELHQAEQLFLELLSSYRKESAEALFRIAGVLEYMEEWQEAISLYREVYLAVPTTEKGKRALFRIPYLKKDKLDDPLGAISAFAEYVAAYPPPEYLQKSGIITRLEQLGFENLFDFQAKTGIEIDGLYGPQTRKILTKMEDCFADILHHRRGKQELYGSYVYPQVYQIAQGLQQQGKSRQAVIAYREFLNLFPSKKYADDSLIAIGRIFKANGLYAEALGVYQRLMDEYPKGDITSHAYIEAAECCLNMDRWSEAKDYYELYIRKFPQYSHVAQAKEYRKHLKKVLQFEDFIAHNPESSKVPSARYQIGTILYKELQNLNGAASQFKYVFSEYPNHFQAPDALFTSGVICLHLEKFDQARELFQRLVADYPDNRLADDALFWIGHTYEYKARALGKLDEKRIVLKQRDARERVKLIADLETRREFDPGAQLTEEQLEESEMEREVLSLKGSTAERVKILLKSAIRSYQEVVQQFEREDMAPEALLHIGKIYTEYLKEPEKGMEAYERLLTTYPGSKKAVDAQYEVGQYYIEAKEWQKSIQALKQFVFTYRNDSRVPEAMLTIAECYREQKEWEKAIDAYKKYINAFPQDKNVKEAEEQIRWIEKYYF